MPYTAVNLVNNAWYRSGIVARGLETITGEQASDGLRLLNVVLSKKSSTGQDIPYYTHTEFNAVINQEKYFVPNLIQLEEFTFNLTGGQQSVRFAIKRDGRRAYFGSPRIDDISSLIIRYYSERVNGGTNIFVYFLPSDTFKMKVTGRFSLNKVIESTDLETTLDAFYVNYLEFLLAEQICLWYKIGVPPAIRQEILELNETMKDINAPDLTPNHVSLAPRGTTLTWGYVNLGRGFMP